MIQRLFFNIFAIFALALSAVAADDFNFDGILAGMGATTSSPAPQKKQHAKQATKADHFDAILEAMGGNNATKAAAPKGNDLMIASIADAMSVSRTLDFLDGVYSSPIPSYGTNSLLAGSASGRPDFSTLLPNGAQLPIAGRVTSGFGYRPKFGRMHKGIDIALNVGDTVAAAIDGTVIRVSNDPRGYGVFVCVRHENGLETRYAHLSGALCTPGQRVYAGQAIGLGGNTGNSTGPHLHFETRVQGEAVDPSTMFDFAMPAGRNPYRTLSELDQRNPKFIHPAAIPVGEGDATSKSTYVVRLGDTVRSIARKHGVSELTLCRLNMVNVNEPLTPGRMLKLR